MSTGKGGAWWSKGELHLPNLVLCLVPLREDQGLQLALLRWTGLSARQARKVLEAIPEHRRSCSLLLCCCLA